MLTDLVTTLIHHGAAFGLVAVVGMQWMLLRQDPSAALIQRIARLDLVYGLLALIVLTAGLLRAFLGAKGWSFYAANPAFHAKLTLFVVIGLISIAPTLRIRRWVAAARDPQWTVPAKEWASTRRSAAIGFHLLLLIPLLAALAARGAGMH